MKVGGEREIRIQPHLAFGGKGYGDAVPANALIIAKVKLFAIVEPNFQLPSKFDRYRQIIVDGAIEQDRKLCLWQFGIVNDGGYSVTLIIPSEDNPRMYQHKTFDGEINKDEADELFAEIKQFDGEIVKKRYSEKVGKRYGVSYTRDTKEACCHVTISEHEKVVSHFYARDRQLQSYRLMILINDALTKVK